MDIERRVVGLEKKDKVLYILLAFFTPLFWYTFIISHTFIVTYDIKKIFPLTIALGLFVLIFSLAFLITLVFEYSKFVFIDEEFLYICKNELKLIKGNLVKPKILDKIKISDIKSIKELPNSFFKPLFLYTYDKEEINLPSVSLPLWLIILAFPFVLPLLIYKRRQNLFFANVLLEHYLDIRILSFASRKTPDYMVNKIINSIIWFCCFIYIIFGILGFLFLIFNILFVSVMSFV